MTTSYEDVLMLAVKRTFLFVDYEPRDVPGFQSNIAKVVGCSEHQTKKLLAAVDHLEDDPHFKVEREEVSAASQGAKGREDPVKILVTVSGV